ncbi:hypothetical protein HYE82_05520 [Streptomyces sp. BR123]|uniref:hypothetical protein n=1 Tax=Streptomyces sp. BR123 TaxID=2749828 RepID=UPI0015C4E3B8|nr:hypothetical protein [Streptomyces sp. BR123]NXY93861.1 hypothetical protein [Streptomyces sp. BR123]
MADLYALDLALDLRESVPDPVLAVLRRHLGEGEPTSDDGFDMYPLLAERGPAYRIGGVCVAELARTETGWSLTARQEVHAELMPDVDALVELLAAHSDTVGVIGQLRWYEDYVLELLINESGTVTRLSLTPEPTLP